MGVVIPKGVMLTGPPGVGKTLIARALAGETNCSFLYASGSEFDEVVVGLGAKRIRNLFNHARENSPCIIFIDEIDSVGSKRSSKQHSYSRQTLNQILTEMDGFKKNEKIIVVAATNLEESIDPALKRPGRFDKIIRLTAPDIKARNGLFELYLNKVKTKKNLNPRNFATRAIGFTGADIKNMINTAAINAVKHKR